MWGPINIFEIIRDYWKYIRKDFKMFPLFTILFLVPGIMAWLFCLLIVNIKKFYDYLITISSILIPLLLNFLMIVYYSLEKTEKTQSTKIEFLEHINSTISMTILLAVIILVFSMIIPNTAILSVLNIITFYLVGLLIVNVLMALVRVYRLIRFEIKEKRKKCEEK